MVKQLIYLTHSIWPIQSFSFYLIISVKSLLWRHGIAMYYPARRAERVCAWGDCARSHLVLTDWITLNVCAKPTHLLVQTSTEGWGGRGEGGDVSSALLQVAQTSSGKKTESCGVSRWISFHLHNSLSDHFKKDLYGFSSLLLVVEWKVVRRWLGEQWGVGLGKDLSLMDTGPRCSGLWVAISQLTFITFYW